MADLYASGSHLVSDRSGYTHHGIYVGDGQVIHYSGLSGILQFDGVVEQVDLQTFRNGGGEIRVRPYAAGRTLPAAEIVARARSKLGEKNYSVWRNNCEHFATWCATGEADSPQVTRIWMALAVGLAVLVTKK